MQLLGSNSASCCSSNDTSWFSSDTFQPVESCLTVVLNWTPRWCNATLQSMRLAEKSRLAYMPGPTCSWISDFQGSDCWCAVRACADIANCTSCTQAVVLVAHGDFHLAIRACQVRHTLAVVYNIPALFHPTLNSGWVTEDSSQRSLNFTSPIWSTAVLVCDPLTASPWASV